MSEFTKAYAETDMFSGCVRLYLRRQVHRDLGGPRFFQHLTETGVVERESGSALETPPLLVSEEAAQALADALWAIGVRPRDSHSVAGEVAAIKEHRDDMRRLIESALEVKLL